MKVLQAHNAYKDVVPLPPLHIHSCGYFSEVGQVKGTVRPNGRPDYQLICITQGHMRVQKEGKEYLFGKGTVLLFRPGDPQIYACVTEDVSAYYWIHFDGTAARQLLESCGMYAGDTHVTEAIEEGVFLINKMITAINRQSPQYQLKLLCYFSDLLARISPQRDDSKKLLTAKLSPALTAMERDIYKTYTVDEYAALCHMSTHYFMHCFKICMGKSPMHYRDDIVMDHAEYFLKNTGLPISEIAGMLGMEDPLYFSRKFKKYFGVSPSLYRNTK